MQLQCGLIRKKEKPLRRGNASMEGLQTTPYRRTYTVSHVAFVFFISPVLAKPLTDSLPQLLMVTGG